MDFYFLPWRIDPFELSSGVFTFAACLDWQWLEVVPEGGDGNVHLLHEQTLHVLQHELGHQLPVLEKRKDVEQITPLSKNKQRRT